MPHPKPVLLLFSVFLAFECIFWSSLGSASAFVGSSGTTTSSSRIRSKQRVAIHDAVVVVAASAGAPAATEDESDTLQPLPASPASRKPVSKNGSSTGRLRFCYERLSQKPPSDEFLLRTPPLEIAGLLRDVLRDRPHSNEIITTNKNEDESACGSHSKFLLPEESYIAVLDAYMEAYRDSKGQQKKRRKNTRQDRQKQGDETNLTRESDQHHFQHARSDPPAMKEVFDGMMATIQIMNEHDKNANSCSSEIVSPGEERVPEHRENGADRPPATVRRTVDPYATVLHALLESSLQDPHAPGQGGDTDHTDRYYARDRLLPVLASMESDPFVAGRADAAAVVRNHKARILQYNKVLKGLASRSDSCGHALWLLERMVAAADADASRSGNGDGSGGQPGGTAEKKPCGSGERDPSPLPWSPPPPLFPFRPGPGIAPDARSFATVLGSEHMGPALLSVPLGAAQNAGAGNDAGGPARCASKDFVDAYRGSGSGNNGADSLVANASFRWYIDASKRLGVFDGYLETFLKRRFLLPDQ